MFETVLKVVGKEFDVTRDQLLADHRSSKRIADARQWAMWLYRAMTGDNWTAQGKLFNRDRTTVRHNVNVIDTCGTEKMKQKLLENVRTATTV